MRASVMIYSFVFFVVGASGVGKSELALQLIKEFKKNKKGVSQVLELPIRSDSIESFINDITLLNTQYDLRLTSLEQTEKMSLANVLEDLFNVCNQRFPNHIKCLLFDDAELFPELIPQINDKICGPMENDNHMNWKVIITTSHDGTADCVQHCDWLKEKDFFGIHKLQAEEAHQILKDVKDLQEAQFDEIYRRLGGNPGVLCSISKSLTANHVGGYVTTCLSLYMKVFRHYFHMTIEVLSFVSSHPEKTIDLFSLYCS